MRYRGLLATYFEFMVRLHAETFVHGQIVGMRAMTDVTPRTVDEKLSDAMTELFGDRLEDTPVHEAAGRPAISDQPPPPNGEPPRRGPGRPPGPGKTRFGGFQPDARPGGKSQ